MNIAFLGNFQKQKGVDLFIDAVKQFKAEHGWYILGSVRDPRAFTSIDKYIKDYGSYNYGGLEERLEELEIDLVLLLNLFPETFSLTFFECVELEYPFVATPVGFPYKVFSNYPYFMDSLTKSDLVKKINQIAKPESLDEAKSFLKNFKAEHWKDFKAKYKIKYNLIEKLLGK